jgi:hypothetical protein
MNARVSLLAAAMMAAAAPCFAQISVVPTAGYVAPMGNWVDETSYQNLCSPAPPCIYKLRPQGGVFVGLVAEYSLNKSIGLAFYGSRTLGGLQRLREDFLSEPSEPDVFKADMATTNLGGMLIFRPLGRTPSGAPKTLYLELGGGINWYSVTTGFSDVEEPADSLISYYSSSTPAVMGGLGLSFPVGPRISLQLFGRAYYQFSAYDSDGLDDFNTFIVENFAPTEPRIEGVRSMLLQFGVGLRVGR